MTNLTLFMFMAEIKFDTSVMIQLVNGADVPRFRLKVFELLGALPPRNSCCCPLRHALE